MSHEEGGDKPCSLTVACLDSSAAIALREGHPKHAREITKAARWIEASLSSVAKKEEPVLWWNGFRRYDERDGTHPSVSESEDTNHDIPLYAGWNEAAASASSATAGFKWPTPTQEQAVSGWAINFDYLTKLSKRVEDMGEADLNQETVECLLLAVKAIDNEERQLYVPPLTKE